MLTTKQPAPGNEQEELFMELMTRALEKKEHTPFEYIKNLNVLFAAFALRRGLSKIVELFDRISKATYEEYCKQIRTNNQADFDVLRASAQYRMCWRFYVEELRIVKEMLSEYWAYINEGHFIEQVILGRDREYYDMWDHRKADKNGTK